MYEDSDQEVWNEKTKERLAKLRAEYMAKKETESPLVPTKRNTLNKAKKSTETNKKQKSLSGIFERRVTNASNNNSSQPSLRLFDKNNGNTTTKSPLKSIHDPEENAAITGFNVPNENSEPFFVPIEPYSSTTDTKGIRSEKRSITTMDQVISTSKSNYWNSLDTKLASKVNIVGIGERLNNNLVTEISEDASLRTGYRLHQSNTESALYVTKCLDYPSSCTTTSEKEIKSVVENHNLEMVDVKVETRANENKAGLEDFTINMHDVKFETVFDTKELAIKPDLIFAKSDINVFNAAVESTSTTGESSETKLSRDIKDPSVWSEIFSYKEKISSENGPSEIRQTYPIKNESNSKNSNIYTKPSKTVPFYKRIPGT
ncbi:4398_t:CDS:2 [Acaulospora morrowiae]|uniref:4398_t:CDS:1 n=1 Tax=Acaulospora morrowiae TaxID=94023 RepID=A0A9N8Z019_9GLOM|nr:4398_t:CDS:2 [Acaulospora morrowiae]